MLKIKDLPGRITVARMRALFEKSINDTAVFKDNTPLGAVTLNGEFSHYANPDTDTMWLGFAIGMRCAERLAATTAEARALAIDVRRWMDGMGEKVFFFGGMPAVEEMNALHARLGAWLGEAQKGDGHDPQ